MSEAHKDLSISIGEMSMSMGLGEADSHPGGKRERHHTDSGVTPLGPTREVPYSLSQHLPHPHGHTTTTPAIRLLRCLN